MRRSDVQLTSILGATADGILAVAPDGKVILFNERFVRLWRIPQSLLDSKNDQVLLDYVLGSVDVCYKFFD